MKKNILYFLAFLSIFKTNLAFEQFDNILLIINYNHPYYNTLPFLKKLYQSYFPNTVFYGEKAHPDVHQIFQKSGALSYYAIADAMERYPDYDGYLFCHDDCIMHPWRFQTFDQTKIWFAKLRWLHADTGYPGNIEHGLRAFPHWHWWRSEFGFSATSKAFNKTDPKYIEMLEKNWGKSNVVVAYSDILYIPQQYCKDFIHLAKIYYIDKVFLEIAIPTIVSCINKRSEWELLQGHNSYRAAVTNEKNYPLEVDFIHPIKCSKRENQNLLFKMFP